MYERVLGGIDLAESTRKQTKLEVHSRHSGMKFEVTCASAGHAWASHHGSLSYIITITTEDWVEMEASC